jgi:hypothetical protein
VTRGAVPGFAAYPAPRRWTPLALTLGLHLLLVLGWWMGARVELARDPPQRAFTFVLVQPPARPKPALALTPPVPRPRNPRPATTSAAAPVVPAPAATPASDPAPAIAPQAEAAPAETPLGDLLGTSTAMAGRVDRELRKGSSLITAEPERKYERFAAAFAAARTSRSYSITLESYEAPDGVVIYRRTINGQRSCYRSGSVGGLVTGFGNADLHGAGNTACPSGVSWTRH